MIFRQLSRRGLEKSQYLHNYLRKPAIFTKKFLEFSPIFCLNIGVVLTLNEFDSFAEHPTFKKIFVFKEIHEGLAHYFNSRYIKGGHRDGMNP